MCNCDRSISWKVEKGRLDEEEGQGRDRLGDRRIFRVISKSVCCCMAFQQYDNLYGFGRGLQRLSSDPLPRVLPSVVFNGSPHPSLSLSFCPLFSLTPYSFLLSFPRTGRALRRPLTRTTRIALPGISEVLSRIQRLHRPSWMDRQSSLTLRLSAPPLSLSLPPYTYPLARLLSLLSLSLSLRRRRRRRLFSRSFFFLRVYPTTRCEIIYCGWILAKNSRVSMPRNTRIPNIPNFFPLPPRFVFLLARYDARGYGR